MFELNEDENSAIFKVRFEGDGATASFFYRFSDDTPSEAVQEYLTMVHGIVAAITTDPDYIYKMGEVVNFGRAIMHMEHEEDAKKASANATTDVDSADLTNVTFHPSLNRTKH